MTAESPSTDDPMGSQAIRPCVEWRLRTRTCRFGRLPQLMGIVNVTPDSFSDGGKFLDPRAAIEQGLHLVQDGAQLLDIGGESTRPFSAPVTEDEELRRVIPVVAALCQQVSVPISIDTSKSAVARAAIAAGAEIINDVTGLTGDPAMIHVARETGAAVCAMHMQGSPQTMQIDPHYRDVVAEISAYLANRRDELRSAGIPHDQICLDPGIGFGKTHEHNLVLLRQCWQLHRLGCPVLIGHSRKGFIAKVLGQKDVDRSAGTIGVCLALARHQVQIIRVHDVAGARQALELFAATGGMDAVPLPADFG